MSASPSGAPRDPVLDRLRGIAILLVVLGHVVIYTYVLSGAGSGSGGAELVRNAIYGFHMPLFMALSGFVLFGRLGSSPGPWIKKRALRLLVPYLSWFMLPALLGRGGGGPGLLGYLSGILRRAGLAFTHPEEGLWFLYVLFVCSVVLILAFQRWRGLSTVLAFVIVWACVAAALRVWPVSGFGLMRFRDLGLFFVGGYLVAGTRDRAPWRQLAFVGSAVFVLAFVAGRLAPILGPAGLPVMYSLQTIGAFVYAIAGISFSFEVASAVRGAPGAVLAFLGVRSMEIYVVHAFFLGVWATTLGLPLPKGILAVLAVTAAAVGGSLVVARALSLWQPTSLLFLGVPARRRAARES